MKTKITNKLIILLLVLIVFGCSSSPSSTKSGSDNSPKKDLTLSITKGASIITNGWADQGNMKYSSATTIEISDDKYSSATEKRKAFTNAIASGSVSSSSVNATDAFIVVSGDVDLSDGLISDSDKSAYDKFNADGTRVNKDIVYKIGSNKTIIGVDNARIKFGGLNINGQKNVIIQNVMFYDAHGSTEMNTAIKTESKAGIDALAIQGASSNIWVDHCSFTDGTCSDLVRNYNHDGQFDIRQGTNITVSYCEFTNHDKVMLIGSNDSYTETTERQITLHHNYFHGCTQRMPRSRGCQMHIYNNVYEDIGIYSLGPGIASMYIVENNYFGSHKGSVVRYFDKTTSTTEETFSKFYHSGNTPAITTSTYDGVDALNDFSKHVVNEKPWTIPYSYNPETADIVKNTVPTKAGSGDSVEIN